MEISLEQQISWRVTHGKWQWKVREVGKPTGYTGWASTEGKARKEAMEWAAGLREEIKATWEPIVLDDK